MRKSLLTVAALVLVLTMGTESFAGCCGLFSRARARREARMVARANSCAAGSCTVSTSYGVVYQAAPVIVQPTTQIYYHAPAIRGGMICIPGVGCRRQ